jgi:hypothetical protein
LPIPLVGLNGRGNESDDIFYQCGEFVGVVLVRLHIYIVKTGYIAIMYWGKKERYKGAW